MRIAGGLHKPQGLRARLRISILITEDYLVNITTGTHMAQICWFLPTEARIIPGQLLQLSLPRERELEQDFVGTHRIIDLDLPAMTMIADALGVRTRRRGLFPEIRDIHP